MKWRLWAGMAGLVLIFGNGCLCGVCGKGAAATESETTFDSSAVKSAAYDEAAQTLTLTFPSGVRYAYRDVPPEVFAGLDQAASKGRFYNQEIKDKFPGTRLDP